MKTVFMPTKYDKHLVDFGKIEAEESVISMRRLIYNINQRIIKSGAKHSHIDPTFMIGKLEKKDVKG